MTGAAIASAMAVAIWLGGLVALGAVTAPIVFQVVSMPQSADAMTLVFRRFDVVAMTCAVVALAAEAARAVARERPTWVTRTRRAATALAAAVATYEGASVAPRIAMLHAGGAVRGLGLEGLELSRLHDLAETCGKLTVALLLVVVAAQALGSSRAATKRGADEARVA